MSGDEPRLIIIADDVTGAADSAARCRSAGLPATIHLGAARHSLPAGAVSFSSDSRHLSAEQAAKRVRSLIAPMVAMPNVIWYKKIDSTLRGNLGAEVDTMLDAVEWQGEAPCAVIGPAFPAQHRGLEDGFLVHADTPHRSLSLPDLLHRQSVHTVAALPLVTVRQGVVVLADAIAEMHSSGVKLLVVDALSDEDLSTVMHAAQRALPHTLFCGSAGMVGLLAESMAQSTDAEDTLSLPNRSPNRHGETVVAVVGSGCTMAHAQIQTVQSQQRARTIKVDLETKTLCQSVDGRQPGSWLLHLPQPGQGTLLEGESARTMVAHLAHRACELIEHTDAAFLILVGGDTAVHVLDCLRIECLTVIEELLPGVPLTTALDGSGARRTVVLKAGNHGDEQTLAELFQMAQTTLQSRIA